ncbi:MAG: glucose-1-phosphate adenylyltransferase, partial [Oscillospiraceae bacterium]|nr:glucose-1-phosphate adenylyltransferase [Oscillospiraceae bacterium]
MLLAGGQGSRLYALTRNVAKPNVPFGGKYRIIDFPLSNCANSGIDTVGVLTQYKPLQLNNYIGNGQPWDLDNSDGGAFILSPYMVEGEKGNWFAGTANAIYQNIQFMDAYEPENVLILSGDHIYKMDYADMLREHLEKDAALTIAVQQVSMEEATRLGIMSCGEDGYINDFEEKPAHPKSDLASMGIYIFNYQKLRSYLIEDEADPNSYKDFGKNIIPNMLRAGEK